MLSIEDWVKRLWRPEVYACVLGLIIVAASLMPAQEARALPGRDLYQHMGSYALVTFFALAGWGRSAWHAGVIMLSIVLLGAVLECVQPAVGRTFDVADLGANSAGVIAGGICVFCVRLWQNRKR